MWYESRRRNNLEEGMELVRGILGVLWMVISKRGGGLKLRICTCEDF